MPLNKYVPTRRQWFHCLEWENDGPTAVLAHGVGFGAGIWGPLATILYEKGYRVLSVDFRGHGDTEDSMGGDYTWQSAGLDMQGLMDKLNVKNALAIGHSYGAVALMLGEALSPGRIWASFLMEPPILFRPPSPKDLIDGLAPLAAQAMRRRSLWDNREQMLESCKKKPMFQNWREEYLEAYVQVCSRERADGTVELKCSPEVESRFYQKLIDTPIEVWNILRSYKPPTMVLIGNPHPQISDNSRELQLLEEVVSHIQIETVEGANHYFPMEQPEEFESRLWEFVARVREEEIEEAAADRIMTGELPWQQPESLLSDPKSLLSKPKSLLSEPESLLPEPESPLPEPESPPPEEIS
jgi:pimeloyl-ACP methyl ester carboxylesterase